MDSVANSRMATSKDVARRAGVSQATVSAALHGTRSNIRVSEATRQRVLAAATELGYLPHLGAQTLRRQRSGVIGYVPRFLRETLYERPVPYYLSTHIARAAMHHGYHVIEVNAESSQTRMSEQLIQFLLSQRVEGVILDAPASSDEVRHFVARGVPVVQLLRPQPVAEASTIKVDAAQGLNSAVDHLCALGHTLIAFIGTGGSDPVDMARLTSVRAALERAALAMPDPYFAFSDSRSAESGYRAMRNLLTLPEPPTAVLIMGDVLALGVLRLLYEQHVRVPDALSVISYGNTFAAFLSPPLTSVGQPFQEIGEQAVVLLIERLGGTTAANNIPEHILLPTELVLRASTGPPARGRTSP